GELVKFSPTLAKLPVVLVLNKLDQLPEESREEWCQHILDELQWKGPVFKTSGLMSEGTKEVVYYLMDQIEQQREREVEDPEYAAEMKAFREQLEAETREQTIAAKEAYRAMRKAQREAGLEDDEDDFEDDEDEGDVESIYVRD
ncbi:MAG: GTPase ObgE, partial [Acinetobacter sp.]